MNEQTSTAKTLVIIPTYNEVENIDTLVAVIHFYWPQMNLLFIDDNSRDGTAARIRYCQERFPGQINLIERSGKLGLGTAYVTGFKWALAQGYTAAIEMDADLSHDPRYLPTMLELLQKHDVVVGSRWIDGGGVKNWGLLRKIISTGGSWYARLCLGVSLHDLTGGFNGWNARVLRKVALDEIVSEGYLFQIEMKYRALVDNFSVKEFPIVFVDRRAGYSKMNARIVIEAMLKLQKVKHAVGSIAAKPYSSFPSK